MASGTVVEDGGGNDGVRKKQRYAESKVYTRKAYKGPKNNINNMNAAAATTRITTATSTTPTATTNNNNDSDKNLITPNATATAPTTTSSVAEFNDENGKKEDKNDENNTIQVPGLQTPCVEDTNSAQQPLVLHPDSNSDDSSGLNRQQDAAAVANSAPEPTAENDVVNKVKINLVSKSKVEKKELRRKLESELDIVRSLVKKTAAKEGPVLDIGFSNSQVTPNNRFDNGLKRVNLELGSVGIPAEITTPILTPTPRQLRPLNQLSISVLENSQGHGEFAEKEKRTPKANQFYRNSEFLLAKDKFPPAESNKKSKLNGKRQGGDFGFRFSSGSKIFKNCRALLERLMKHQHGWVFNAPVDVAGLGLHDYHKIIKQPMDLGTIKMKLNKNWYKSPEEFAEDVRLTFHNAMTYNPKGQHVHIMAEILLQIFEEKWAVMKSEYDREVRFPSSYDMGIPTPTSRKTSLLPPPLDMRMIFDRPELMAYSSIDPRPKPISTTPSSRTPAPKKPKANDPHKRDMTYEEKQKLSTNLQSLPSEMLDNIVQIIKKRNSSLSQHDDEIEVDIDSVDAETLWELDRFVTNYKKSLSKNKRKAELAKARAEAAQNLQQKTTNNSAGAPQETRTDERNNTTSSPVPVGNKGDNATRSSSLSSSSSDSGSSSSDSDSASSSASGSDVGH